MKIHEDASGGASGATSPVSTSYRYYALAILTLTFTIDCIDRNILTILMEPIKQELHLSDTQLGLIYGFCFALFFGLFSVPIAMLADRYNRRNIIAVCVTVFSAMTIVSGFVTNFWQMVLARFGVAIGEAGGAPSAHSMIGDLFAAEKRGAALAVYTVGGVNAGTLFGLLAGGWLNEWFGWRMAFFVLGVPGLIIAALVRFTLREPERGHADGLTAQGKESPPSILAVFRFLWTQRSFRQICYGTAMTCIGGYAAFIWLPTFLMRSYSMSSGEAGTALALILGLVGGAGTFFFGYMSDVLAKRDVRWSLWMVSVAFLIITPVFCGVYLSEQKWTAIALLIYPGFAAACYMPIAFALVQSLATVRMRTQAIAILFLVVNVIGGCLGPQLTGILSDLYHPHYGQESLRYALLTGLITWPWSALHFFLAARDLKHGIARARASG